MIDIETLHTNDPFSSSLEIDTNCNSEILESDIGNYVNQIRPLFLGSFGLMNTLNQSLQQSHNTSLGGQEKELTENGVIKFPIKSSKLEKGDKFFGTITTNVKDPVTGKSGKMTLTNTFTVQEKFGTTLTLQNEKGEEFKTGTGATKVRGANTTIDALQDSEEKERKEKAEKEKAEAMAEAIAKAVKEQEELKKKVEEEVEKQREKEEVEKKKFEEEAFDFSSLKPEDKLRHTIDAGINNIWMVGPAGCGKSTMARNVANSLDRPYLCVSCGIGTSAAEFVGYKYPEREATKFAEFYSKPSIILLDEFTALDPAVAQVVNAALANGEIETTTGLVLRHPECIIIATSNTFGNGADRQYVANNQLDASTIDRFIGGIIEVTYSAEFESQYDLEVVNYVNDLRSCIKKNDLRRIASTRMIQAGHNLKKVKIRDWKTRLIINWSEAEQEIVKAHMLVAEQTRFKELTKRMIENAKRTCYKVTEDKRIQPLKLAA